MARKLKQVYYSLLWTIIVLIALLALIPIAKSDIRIMIIDTGADCSHKAFFTHNLKGVNPEDCNDKIGHGTHVTSLILNGELSTNGAPTDPVCPEVETFVCNYRINPSNDELMGCLDAAARLHVDFVNFSSTGDVFDLEEYIKIETLQKNNTIFVTAAGNEARDLKIEPTFPAMYSNLDSLSGSYPKLPNLKNVIVAGGITRTGQRYAGSNYGIPMAWKLATNVISAVPGNGIAVMTGTSMATALATHDLVQQACKRKAASVKVK